MSNPIKREKLLREVFDTFISGCNENAFSLEDFMQQAGYIVKKFMDEESLPLGLKD
jgi:hypothetical protein